MIYFKIFCNIISLQIIMSTTVQEKNIPSTKKKILLIKRKSNKSIKNPNVYWVRQNPYKLTDQQAIYNLIQKRSIVTVPFGHTKNYKFNCINVNSMNSDETMVIADINGWESNLQDIDFFNLPTHTIIVILFSGIHKCIIAELIDNPHTVTVCKDTDMYEHYNNHDEITIINNHISQNKFEPLCRNIKIHNEIDKLYRGRIQTFGKVKNNSELYIDVINKLT